ncbi:glycosyltransferase family 2 protein [Candidatus Pelagibacter sp. HIMB1509]|uniref:glycosyltransferase family 2 protein n=1 Tax=Candidatus Pelagibacter sp. HIMB1509 TaxID=3413339 RepID=UPI003F86E016
MKLSIIVPCYNEQGTIKEILDKIQNLKLSVTKEIIIVDDNSNDGTEEILKNYKKIQNIKILRHLRNEGKGSAVKTAKKYVTGEIIIIQDADLEYDPNDFSKLIKPILDKKFKVVYGSRVLNQKRYNAKGFTSKLRVFGNHFLTIISNILNKQKLTDAHTCYKVFDKEVFDKINLEEKDFAFCPEVTTKISKLGYEIEEVPINYNGRSYEEGKKIRFVDAYRALKTLIKYR